MYRPLHTSHSPLPYTPTHCHTPRPHTVALYTYTLSYTHPHTLHTVTLHTHTQSHYTPTHCYTPHPHTVTQSQSHSTPTHCHREQNKTLSDQIMNNIAVSLRNPNISQYNYSNSTILTGSEEARAGWVSANYINNSYHAFRVGEVCVL